MGGNSLRGIQRPSQKNHLQINLTCIGNWNVNLKELDEHSRSRSSSQSSKKNGKKSSNSRFRVVGTKVVLKEMGVGKNGAKMCVA